ncbi:MAG: hypothetical protein KF744_03565 [Taibaiella sp.]|nr:hypothetical protein [Taibaiella sp.]
MTNKFLFSTALAATILAQAAEAKTVVTPIARSLNPVTYYSASTLVVGNNAIGSSGVSWVMSPGIRNVDINKVQPQLFRASGQFALGFRALERIATPVTGATANVAPIPPASVERTRVKPASKEVAGKRQITSLDELIRNQRANHTKQLANAKKHRRWGKHSVIPIDRNAVRVCIAARPARVPLAVHRAIPRHGIVTKYAMPLTKADIERKNEHAKEYKLGYARKSKHLRKLSPERIAKFRFYPPLRRFDTDVLVVAAEPTQPIIAYVPVATEDVVLYSAAPASGVQKTIAVTATVGDDILGLPTHELYAAGLFMKGNVPAKTGINSIIYAAADIVTPKSKAKRGYMDVPVAIRNAPRGGLHQVTYDELGHSPPVGLA